MMRYSFRKDKAGYSFGVYLTKDGVEVFVCNIYPSEARPHETRSQAVDRLIKDAGYEGREDFFNHNKR